MEGEDIPTNKLTRCVSCGKKEVLAFEYRSEKRGKKSTRTRKNE